MCKVCFCIDHLAQSICLSILSGPFGACKVCGIKSHLARLTPYFVSKLGILLTKSISKTHPVSKTADLLTNSVGSVLTTPLRMGGRHENSLKRSYRTLVEGW